MMRSKKPRVQIFASNVGFESVFDGHDDWEIPGNQPNHILYNLKTSSIKKESAGKVEANFAIPPSQNVDVSHTQDFDEKSPPEEAVSQSETQLENNTMSAAHTSPQINDMHSTLSNPTKCVAHSFFNPHVPDGSWHPSQQNGQSYENKWNISKQSNSRGHERCALSRGHGTSSGQFGCLVRPDLGASSVRHGSSSFDSKSYGQARKSPKKRKRSTTSNNNSKRKRKTSDDNEDRGISLDYSDFEEEGEEKATQSDLDWIVDDE